MFRLIHTAVPTSGGKPIAPLNNRFYGNKLSDWLNKPSIGDTHTMHAPGPIEIR